MARRSPQDPVGLHSRNNFSCYAFNDGGNGTLATINIDVQVAPTFISKLPPYTGFLYSEPNVVLSCRVECVPHCSSMFVWHFSRERVLKLFSFNSLLVPWRARNHQLEWQILHQGNVTASRHIDRWLRKRLIGIGNFFCFHSVAPCFLSQHHPPNLKFIEIDI